MQSTLTLSRKAPDIVKQEIVPKDVAAKEACAVAKINVAATQIKSGFHFCILNPHIALHINHIACLFEIISNGTSPCHAHLPPPPPHTHPNMLRESHIMIMIIRPDKSATRQIQTSSQESAGVEQARLSGISKGVFSVREIYFRTVAVCMPLITHLRRSLFLAINAHAFPTV